MLNDYLSTQNRMAVLGKAPAFRDIFGVLQLAVEELRRGLASGEWKSEEDDQCPKQSKDSDPIRRLSVTALHLVCLICRLDRDRTESEERKELSTLLYELVQMNPTDLDGRTLLNLSCDSDTSTIGRFPVCRFPALSVIQLLIDVGADTNDRDKNGETALHVILKNKVGRPSIVRCLLQNGADADVRSNAGLRANELISRKPGLDIPIVKFMTLKCYAASVLRKYEIPFRNRIPMDLTQFVEMH